MKFVFTILMAVFFQLNAMAQLQGITLSLQNAPLATAFKLIEQQTKYRFVYSDEAMTLAKPVYVEVKNASLENVLGLCFANQSLGYSLEGNVIIISINKPSQKAALPYIKGKVVAESGEAIAGATIYAKQSNKGTFSNENGEFSLTDLSENDVLVITSVGSLKQEIQLTTQDYIVVKLRASVSTLDETMVIGYGYSTKRFNVGSVAKISSSDINEQSQGNVLAALEGKAPGLVVNQSTGLPGSSVKIQIRGQNSLKTNPGSSDFMGAYDYPLFIIDGVPFAPQNANINQFGSLNAAGMANPVNRGEGMSPFNSLNTDDIESIEILRDADATAIYGSRGANGVVIITTKKGKAGKTRFSLNGFTGYSKVTRTMSLLNTDEYLEMRKEAFYNDSIDNPSANIHPDTYNAPDILIFDNAKYTNWQKYFLGGTANTTSVNGSLSGGTNNTQFLLGAGYRKETYVFPGDFSDQKVSFATSINHKSDNRKLNIDFSANYVYDKNTSSSNSELLKASYLPPNYPDLLNDDGSIRWNYNGVNLYNNPMAALKQKYLLQTFNLMSHLQVGYEILRNVSGRVSVGYNKFEANENSQIPTYTQNPVYNPTGSSYFGTNHFQTWIMEPQLEYKKAFLTGKLDVLLGGTYQQSLNELTNINGYGYSNDALLNSPAAAGSVSISDGQSLYKYVAVFGRLNYIFREKYIINLTGRRDGSSRFGPGRQFGNFGSIGGGWIFSESRFFKSNAKWLTYGKVKASYGTTGNDNIGDYQFLPVWNISYNSYQGVRGYVPQNLYNPDFGWAVNKKFQAGLEVGILSDKLVGDFVWFQNRCGNQLVSYILPNQTGFTNVTQNFDAVVLNSGLEISVNSTFFKSKSFVWTASFNISFPKNKLVSFPGLESSPYAYYYKIGESLNVLQKFNFIGVNDTSGVYQFSTSKNQPTYFPVDPDDNIIIGTLDPKYYGGFKSSMSFKGFILDIFLEFKKQLGLNYLGQIANNNPPGILNALYGNQPVSVLQRWMQPGDNTTIEKFTTDYGSLAGQVVNTFYYSSGSYSDASYLRLKTVSLSYNIPDTYLKRLKITACKIYVNAQNLLTITSYKGADPETQSLYGVPPMKTIVAGLQFNF